MTREAGPRYGAVTAVVAPSLATEENSGIKIQGGLMTLFFRLGKYGVNVWGDELGIIET